MLITVAEITQDPVDNEQLLPLVSAARENGENTGPGPLLTLADTGYFSGANLTACAEAGVALAMPEKQPHPAHRYHKDRLSIFWDRLFKPVPTAIARGPFRDY